MTDASTHTYACKDPSKWDSNVNPMKVDAALDQLGSRFPSDANLDNAIMRADGTGGTLQDSQVILSDVGGMSELRSIIGETGIGFSIIAAAGGPNEFTAQGGQGAATGPGGDATLSGGPGGVTSGNGANAIVIGGIPQEGDGGDAKLIGADGVGTDQDGGDAVITSGSATGSGTPGVITLDGVDAATLVPIISAAKTADTDRTETTDFADDPTLVLTPAINTTYILTGMIGHVSNTTADFKFEFGGPSSGATIQVHSGGGLGGTSTSRSFLLTSSFNQSRFISIVNTSRHFLWLSGVITIGSTAGDIAFRWAQNTSNAVDTTVTAGSWLMLTKQL